jgi:hypothetical protein
MDATILSDVWNLEMNSLGDTGLCITNPKEGVTVSIHDEVYTFESREALREFVSILEEAAVIYGCFDDPADFEIYAI